MSSIRRSEARGQRSEAGFHMKVWGTRWQLPRVPSMYLFSSCLVIILLHIVQHCFPARCQCRCLFMQMVTWMCDINIYVTHQSRPESYSLTLPRRWSFSGPPKPAVWFLTLSSMQLLPMLRSCTRARRATSRMTTSARESTPSKKGTRWCCSALSKDTRGHR